MVIGEAGESCALYIADRPGMPENVLRVAAEAAYGKNADMSIVFDTVENRKARHDMERKYTEETIVYEKGEELNWMKFTQKQ